MKSFTKIKAILLISLFPLFTFSQQAVVYYPNGLIKSDFSVGVSRIIYIELKDHPELDRSKFSGLFRPKVIEFTDGTKIQYGFLTNGEQVSTMYYRKGEDDWWIEYSLNYNPWEHKFLFMQKRLANKPADPKPYDIDYSKGRKILHPTIPHKYLHEMDLTAR
jgi:hypothetical protein